MAVGIDPCFLDLAHHQDAVPFGQILGDDFRLLVPNGDAKPRCFVLALAILTGPIAADRKIEAGYGYAARGVVE